MCEAFHYEQYGLETGVFPASFPVRTDEVHIMTYRVHAFHGQKGLGCIRAGEEYGHSVLPVKSFHQYGTGGGYYGVILALHIEISEGLAQ